MPSAFCTPAASFGPPFVAVRVCTAIFLSKRRSCRWKRPARSVQGMSFIFPVRFAAILAGGNAPEPAVTSIPRRSEGTQAGPPVWKRTSSLKAIMR